MMTLATSGFQNAPCVQGAAKPYPPAPPHTYTIRTNVLSS